MKHTALAFFLLLLSFPVLAAEEQEKESAYERILRTGTIRCGYVVYPPHVIMDLETKKISGISADIITEAARVLDLKVVWAEELGWGNTVEAMRSGRVDAICNGFWQNPVEGKYVGFTVPMYYSAVGAYVKADNTSILPTLENVNRKEVRISSADGAMASLIAQQDFPESTVVSLPNMTDETQMLMEVSTGKADITFIETYVAEKFLQANPGSVKNITPENPVRLFGNTFAIPMEDFRLKSMLDSALIPMIQGGTVDRIIKKYEEVPGGIYRVARPFQSPE